MLYTFERPDPGDALAVVVLTCIGVGVYGAISHDVRMGLVMVAGFLLVVLVLVLLGVLAGLLDRGSDALRARRVSRLARLATPSGPDADVDEARALADRLARASRGVCRLQLYDSPELFAAAAGEDLPEHAPRPLLALGPPE